MEKFEMGLIQREWVKSLKANGDAQISGSLGKRINGTGAGYQACCLGELLVTECRIFELPPPVNEENMIIDSDRDNAGYLDYSYKRLGLRTRSGSLEGYLYYKGASYGSLASANDAGIPWSVIAEFIESNPEKIFTHPY